MLRPAISRYGATSPDLLRWFKGYNANRKYRDKVKPFGFLLSMSVSPFALSEKIIDFAAETKRRPKARPLKPAAAYDTDHAKAAASAFCRDSGEPISPDMLKTYAETLAQYHLHSESKFLNGSYGDKGTTLRRHVQMSGVCNIGKESNDWEKQAVLGFDPDAAPDYGLSPDEIATIPARLAALTNTLGTKNVAQSLRISNAVLTQLKSAKGNWRNAASKISPDLIVQLENEASVSFDRKHHEMAELRNAIEIEGLRTVARKLGVDPSNLRRHLKNMN